jgi:ABC-2 type transport system permease protein
MDLGFLVPAICFALLALGSSMILISTPSISLEDRNLWIVQSLPIRGAHVLLAKVSSHMIISTPFIIACSLILSIGFKMSIINSLFLLVSSVVTSAFFAYFGMLLGLLFPKFDWQNENVAVKQGFAIFGAMFGGMVWAMLMSGVVVILSFISFILGAIAVTLLNAGMCAVIHMYFLKKGEKRFALLKQ